MKRIKYLIFTLILGVVGLVNVHAATLTMSRSSSSVTVGNSVKVTVKASGAAGWEYCINYDSSLFKLTSGNKCVLGGTLAGNANVTFTFKSLKQGTGTFSLGSVSMLDDNANELKVSKGSVVVTVKAQSEINVNPKTDTPLNDNANLSLLEVEGYELSPKFDKNVTEYSVTVPNDIEKVNINARREVNTTSISAVPSIENLVNLTEGNNKVTITLIAQKGNKKVYTINILREENAPLTVNVDGKEYTVMRKFDDVDKPKYYTDDTVEIEGQEVPALVSDVTGYELVALKDSEGNIELYSYENGEFKKYVEVNNEILTLIPRITYTYVKNYEQTKEIEINGNKVKVYYCDNSSDFVLIYAMNVSNGETGWYSYDIKDGSLQRYIEPKEEKKGKDVYFYLAIGFAIVSGFALLIIFVLMGLNGRLRSKNEKLVRKLKERKVKIVEHPVFDTEMSVSSWKDIKEDGTKSDEDYDDDSFFAREDDTMSNINEDVEIKADAFDTQEIPIIKDEEEKPLTRAEKKKRKKKAKADKAAEEAELKAMQEDFLKTQELEITKETNLETTKKRKTKKKK